jgi:hypothetical protein
MTRKYSNLSEGSWKTGLFVLPAAATAALMAGVVVPSPEAGRRILDEQGALEQRSTAYEAERAQSESFELSGGAERLDALEQALDAVLPAPQAALELWSLTRLCFERAGYATQTLHLGELESAGLAEYGDRIVVRRAQVEGASNLDALVEAIDLLRDLGQIVSVEELHLDRQSGLDTFHSRLQLAYWSCIPLSSPLAAATAPATSGLAAQDSIPLPGSPGAEPEVPLP